MTEVLALLSSVFSLGAFVASLVALAYSLKAYNVVKTAVGRGVLVTEMKPKEKPAVRFMSPREKIRWIEKKWAREVGRP